MKVKDIIKRQTTMVAMAVILVVITAIGVSYSVFFDVEKNQSNQTITAGIFKLTVTGNSKLTDFNAKTDVQGNTSTAFTYTVSNTGTLDDNTSKKSNLKGKYYIYVYADDANVASLGNLTLSVNGATPKAINAYASSTCNVSSSKNVTCYQIDTGELAVGASASKPVRIWVNEDSTPESADGQKVSLSLFIKGEVNES